MLDYNDLDKKARPGAFSTLDMEVLVPEVQAIEPPGVYLEIGVDKGKSLSVARMVAKEGVRVFGIDLREDPKVPGTTFLRGDSREVVKTWDKDSTISVLFIDGDHSYEGCHADIVLWYPHMKKDGVMLFHDCDESSPGVLQAVAEFVNTHIVKKFELFKRTDKNTSMARIAL